MATAGPVREAGAFAVALAREAVERFVTTGERIEAPPDPPGILGEPGAAFVTLSVGGRVRGCIGRFTPSRPRLIEEVLAAAVGASRDPRYPPVQPLELRVLRYEVSFLGPLEPLARLDGHDPRVFGLVVEGRRRRGGVLPDLPGVDTAARQLRIARRKARVWPLGRVRLFRFRTERHVGGGPA